MKRDRGTTGDPITIVLTTPLADKIRQLHAVSQLGEVQGNKTSIQKWCIEIIENFVVDNRKGGFQL